MTVTGAVLKPSPTTRGDRVLRRAVARLGWYWQRLRLRDALVLSSPIVLFLGYLLGVSTLDYYRYSQFDDFWSRPATIEHFFQARFHAATHVLQALRVEHQLNPEAPESGIIRLNIAPAAWDSIQGLPTEVWGRWFEGTIARENTLTKVKVRKRGDNSVHWLTPKGSITVKTEVAELFKGYQTFGLSSKDVLTAYVANRMASELGLFAGHTEITPVFVNNRFYGLFRFNEPIDENFLRGVLRLPGNIFRGDAAERGEYFKGTNRNLFENLYIWERAAKSQRPNASATAGLEDLLIGSNATSLAEHQRLLALVKPAEVERLVAYLLVMGDPWHMDGVHNQFWYEDPWSMLLSPIPWDIRLLDLTHPPPPGRVNRFLQEALRDPFVVDAVLRQVQHMLDQEQAVETAERLGRAAYDRYRPYFDYEEYRAGLIPDVGTPAQVSAPLRKNAETLHRWIGDARVAAVAGDNGIVDLESRGYAGSDLLGFEVANGGAQLTVRMDRNNNGALDPADPSLAGHWSSGSGTPQFLFEHPEPIYPAWETRTGGIRPGTQLYRFFVSGAHGAIRPLLRNRLTGGPTKVEALEPGTPLAPAYSWHPWRFPVLRGTTHRFAGQVHLTETLEIPPGDTLVFSPGTTIKLDPDVSLLIRGHLESRGEAGRPVTVEQAVPGKPWGTVALQGQGADGSVITWTRFYGGGGQILHEVEYTGSVSLHYVDRVSYDHLEIAHNVRSDDAFHAYHSTFVMRNCLFKETNADAIDLDYSDGDIVHCRFEHAGNDAMDLMTSNPRIMDNYIEGSDDKGVSVGEDSNPFIFNNYITRCERGIEVKDASEPIILNNTLVGNKVGIRERLKNVRYWHGGWGKVINTVITGNKKDREIDKNSRLSVWASVVGKDTFPAGPADLPGWLYRTQGIRPDSIKPGVLGTWGAGPSRPALLSAEFAEDFGDYSDGWTAAGMATHLEKRNRNLTATLRPWDKNSEVEFPGGVLERAIDWDLRGARDTSLVVFEIAARDMLRGEVSLVSEQGSVTRPFTPSGDLSSYRFVTVSLPPGRYRAIRIALVPVPGLNKTQRSTGLVNLDDARVNLHGYQLFSSLDSLPRPPRAGRSAAGER